MSVPLRVDEDVYDAILDRAHALERAAGRRISLSDALRDLLGIIPATQPESSPA